MPGELYVNWADGQFGVANPAGNSQDLIAVRIFSTTANYAIGDFVTHSAVLYRAKVAITAGAFVAGQWVAVATLTDTQAVTTAFTAADTAITNAFHAADTAITTAYSAADMAILAELRAGRSYRNRVINGDMSVDERNGGFVVSPLTAPVIVIDKWRVNSTAGMYNKGAAGRNLLIGPPIAFGFPYFFGWECLVAATPAAGDTIQIVHTVEAVDFADAMWGTVNAQPVTISFLAYSVQGGMCTAALRDSSPAISRSYVFPFTLPSGAWTQVRVTIPGDTVGANWTPAATASVLSLGFNISSGNTWEAPTPNIWADGNFVSLAGALNVAGNSSGAYGIGAVALMVGAAAANATPNFPKLADNMHDCKRYFRRGQLLQTASGQVAGGGFACAQDIIPSMRAIPTGIITTNTSINLSSPTLTANANAAIGSGISTASGGTSLNFIYSLDADF